jgi:hypothetical protein
MFTYYTCRIFHKVLTPLHNRVLKQRDPQLVDNRVHSNVNNLTPLETEVEIRICSSPLKVGQFTLLLIMLSRSATLAMLQTIPTAAIHAIWNSLALAPVDQISLTSHHDVNLRQTLFFE